MIHLHKTKGVNPHLTYCPRCGGEGSDLILLGARDYVDTCNACGLAHVGGAPRNGVCGGCNTHRTFTRRKLAEGERLPGGLCAACETEATEHAAIVAEGGVYFRCADCHASGVIKSNDFTAQVRKAHGLENGEPCGVEFTKDDCPACS